MVINPEAGFLNSRVLLIDIGGTNIRTASADIGSSSLIKANKQNLDCLDSFDEMLQSFLDEDISIKHLVFSIAGPKLHHSIAMTNREFKIDESEILKKFKVNSCHILNDWESIGHGLSLFKKEEMNFINDGDPFNETALILGPGTGLGAAQVIKDNIVLPTEIGNSSFTIPGLFSELGLHNTEDFNILKAAYEERDIIAIVKFAVKYGVKVKLEKRDSEIIERKISSFNDKIQTIENSLIWQYFKGDLPTKKLVIEELQNTHNIKLTEKDIEDFLSI